MKKLIISLILLGAGIISLSSCGEKSRVDELKDFIEEVKKDGSDYSEEKWKEVNEEFSKLLDKINAYDDLSAEELQEVARLQGEYAATVFKSKGKEVMEQMEKAGAALNGFMEGLTEESDDKKE